jgi:dolichol-phosphate mannosyltransferase
MPIPNESAAASGRNHAGPELAVVLPVFNEAPNLRPLAGALRQTLAAMGLADALIVFVDDGSTDDSREQIRQVQHLDAGVRLIAHAANGGYGAAVRSGLGALAETPVRWVMLMDADRTMDEHLIARFREKILAGDDLVIGSRYEFGLAGPTRPAWWRTLVSRIGSRIARACLRFPLRDYTLGMRAVRYDLAARWTLRSSSFAILLEMVTEARRLGARVSNVPVSYIRRDAGASKFRYRPGLVCEYLRYALRGLRGG